MKTFRLIPYPASDLPKIDISGEVEWMERRLSVRYAVIGETERILIPAISESPIRKDEL